MFDYISERSPAAARRLSRTLQAAFSTLSRYPDIGPQTDITGVRVFILKSYPYKIFYPAFTDQIEIVHLRHDARQPFSS